MEILFSTLKRVAEAIQFEAGAIRRIAEGFWALTRVPARTVSFEWIDVFHNRRACEQWVGESVLKMCLAARPQFTSHVSHSFLQRKLPHLADLQRKPATSNPFTVGAMPHPIRAPTTRPGRIQRPAPGHPALQGARAMSPATCASPPRGQRTGSFDLRNRIKAARNALAHCDLCEWHCGVDRTRGESAPCRLSDETRCFRRYLSFAEEPELIPAYRVYLAGCNFRCRFCDTGPTCFDPHSGLAIEPGMFAAELQVAIKQGARSVQLLGGEPSLHPHTILELAEAADGKLPIVLDTNLYMTPQVLDWLLDVLTWVVGDFKFGNDNCARSLAGVERYWSVVTRNLLHVASSTTPLLVRHLLMPGHFDCCFRPVADWSSEHLPGVRFELSTAYVPCWRAARDDRIGRVNRPAEVTAARKYLSGLNLRTGDTTDG